MTGKGCDHTPFPVTPPKPFDTVSSGDEEVQQQSYMIDRFKEVLQSYVIHLFDSNSLREFGTCPS